MPCPCALDYFFELGEVCFPAELCYCFRCVGGEDGWVAGSAVGFDYVEVFAGDFFYGFYYFADGVALAVSEVEDEFVFVVEFVECEEVCFAEVLDVDVVADACSVGCGVVCAEDFYGVSFSHCGLYYEWDEMGFGSVVLAECGVLARAARVEVSECGVSEFFCLAEELAHSFDGPFAFAVWIDGGLWEVLCDGESFGHSVDGGGGAEDELFDVGLLHCGEQVVGVAEVVVVIL